MSGYGTQLREKQKMKRMYGLLERQFRKIFENAKKFKGNTGDQLVRFLEQRLDNVLYRLSLVPTRAAGRQLITHGHVLVDGKKMTIPSSLVQPGSVLSLTVKGAEVPCVKKMLEEGNPQIPEWLERKGPTGKIIRLPERADVKEDINEQLIIEFYSR